jgi:uncharacterized protein DUF1566
MKRAAESALSHLTSVALLQLSACGVASNAPTGAGHGGSGTDSGLASSLDGGSGSSGGGSGDDSGSPCTCTVGATQCASTNLETCERSSPTCPSWIATTCPTDAGVTLYVCERYGAPSCVDPNWAEWPMPNSSVDSPPAPNLASLANNGDGTVSDNVTGLMWQQASAPDANGGADGTYSQADALAYCAELQLAGHADWRLPALIELESIRDFTVSNPAIDVTVFPDTVSKEYWSSTPLAGPAPGSAWFVFFYFGDTDNDVENKAHYVRCVR